MSVALATRFDMLKKPATAAMSQMSRAENPALRSAARSASSIAHGSAVSLTAKSSMARSRGERRGAVRRQAVVAAVHLRHRDRDHLALELGKAGGRDHEIVVHGDERLELAHVERVGAQHVGHEAELLLAFLEVGCHGIARCRVLEAERRDAAVIVGGLAARRSAAFLSAGARAGLAFHPGCRAIAGLLSVLGHGSLPRCGSVATAYSSRAHRRNPNCSRRMRRDRRDCGHTERARASGPASGTNDAVLSMSMTSTQPARVAGLGPASDDGARALI